MIIRKYIATIFLPSGCLNIPFGNVLMAYGSIVVPVGNLMVLSMVGKQLGIRIPDIKIYESFIEHVKAKYGTARGFTGRELQNAIVQFLEHPEGINIDEIEGKYRIENEKLKKYADELRSGYEEKLKKAYETHLEIDQKHSKELRSMQESHLEKEQKYGNEIKKLEQRVTVAKTLSKQAERLKKINQEKEKEIGILRKEREYLQAVQERNDQLQNQHDKLRNKFDHLQERFNKSQTELNTLERENSDLRVMVAKVGKLSFWERVLNRLPSEVKELDGESG